ncbi:MAG: hypothetical protein AVDCRST_MAG66-3820, partial [uncultured Pseudonocardia sp.]
WPRTTPGSGAAAAVEPAVVPPARQRLGADGTRRSCRRGLSLMRPRAWPTTPPARLGDVLAACAPGADPALRGPGRCGPPVVASHGRARVRRGARTAGAAGQRQRHPTP